MDAPLEWNNKTTSSRRCCSRRETVQLSIENSGVFRLVMTLSLSFYFDASRHVISNKAKGTSIFISFAKRKHLVPGQATISALVKFHKNRVNTELPFMAYKRLKRRTTHFFESLLTPAKAVNNLISRV